MKELTSNTPKNKLDEVTVMGRTVYVSQQSQEAYVEYQDELVSMTNLNAWNYLMEQAKIKAIDGYEDETTFEEKQIQDHAERVAEKVTELARDMQRDADRIKQAARTNDE